MGRPKFSEEQIAIALQQHEAGSPVADVCRQIGASESTFYIWKKKYANLGVSELRELRQLRDENIRLRRLVNYLTLNKRILSDVVKESSEAVEATRFDSLDYCDISDQRATCLHAGRVLTCGAVSTKHS